MLFQSMSNANLYESALRRAGVPFYTVAGRGFYNRQEVRDCLNLLSALENASDEMALVGSLRSPMFALSDDAIFWLSRGENGLLESLERAAGGDHPHQDHLADDQLPRIRHAARTVTGLRAVKDRLSLSELVERMLAETGLAAVHLTQFAGRQAAANLRKLTDLARAYEQRGEFGLRQFIDYLRDLVTTEYHEGLADVQNGKHLQQRAETFGHELFYDCLIFAIGEAQGDYVVALAEDGSVHVRWALAYNDD